MIAYGAFGGRIDHALAAIHIVAKFKESSYAEMRNTDLVLMDQESIGMMLETGESRVYPSKDY